MGNAGALKIRKGSRGVIIVELYRNHEGRLLEIIPGPLRSSRDPTKRERTTQSARSAAQSPNPAPEGPLYGFRV